MEIALTEFTVRLNEVEVIVGKIQRRIQTIKVNTEEVKQDCSTEEDLEE